MMDAMKHAHATAQLMTKAVAGLALSALVVSGWSGSASAVTHAKPALVDALCLQPGQTKPKEIVMACADGNAVAEHLRWSSWRSTSARAKGTLHQNDCTPYCALGTFYNYPAVFDLSDMVRADGREYFTKLTISISGKITSTYPKRKYSVSDCYVNPPKPFVPRCPSNLAYLG
jgi:hypothetical protein